MSGVATNMSDDFTYLGYTDEVHTKLDSIEQRLLRLAEDLMLEEIGVSKIGEAASTRSPCIGRCMILMHCSSSAPQSCVYCRALTCN